MKSFDFSGWATRNDLKCSDGRVIRNGAFKHCDGQTVPLVWNHKHNDGLNVLGHAVLEHRDEGVYAYCSFNESEQGQNAKLLVKHGDISSLSIYANNLKQQGSNVIHGSIREVSLVLAGANPGAFIDTVIQHSDNSDEEAEIYNGEHISLYHAEDLKKEGTDQMLQHAEEKTVADVFETLNDEQKTVVYALIGQALEDEDESEDGSTKGDENMKHNIFDKEELRGDGVLSHSDQAEIIKLARTNSVGSLKTAIGIYTEGDEQLAHGIENIEVLFPDYKDVRPGAPEMLTTDTG